MSVIAAAIRDNKIMLAADSILIKDNLKKNNFQKLIKIDDEFVVGGCGHAEELSLFFEYARTHVAPDPRISDVLRFMQKFGDWKAENYMLSNTIDNCYIIVVCGRLFEIDSLFVQEVDDYTAIGEGEAYALAALHLGHSPYEAVKVSCDLCYYASEPIIYYEILRGA